MRAAVSHWVGGTIRNTRSTTHWVTTSSESWNTTVMRVSEWLLIIQMRITEVIAALRRVSEWVTESWSTVTIIVRCAITLKICLVDLTLNLSLRCTLHKLVSISTTHQKSTVRLSWWHTSELIHCKKLITTIYSVVGDSFIIVYTSFNSTSINFITKLHELIQIKRFVSHITKFIQYMIL